MEILGYRFEGVGIEVSFATLDLSYQFSTLLQIEVNKIWCYLWDAVWISDPALSKYGSSIYPAKYYVTTHPNPNFTHMFAHILFWCPPKFFCAIWKSNFF